MWKSLNGIVKNGDNYMVSTDGTLKNTVTGNKLKGSIKDNGYIQVPLSLEGKKIKYYLHRLVALAFIPNPEGKPEVNHEDGNKLNCHVDNLEWVTRLENVQHAFETGLVNQDGSDNWKAVLDEDKVKQIKELYTTGKYKQNQLAEQFGVDKQTINNILNGKSWTHVKIDKEIKIHSGKSGENNSQSKLTEDDVRKIRELHATGKYSYRKLGEMFGISKTVAGHIVTFKTWKHVV